MQFVEQRIEPLPAILIRNAYDREREEEEEDALLVSSPG